MYSSPKIPAKVWLSFFIGVLTFSSASWAASGILYVLNDSDVQNQIYAFSADESTGVLTPLSGFPVNTGGLGEILDATERLAVDQMNSRLYVLNAGSNTLSVFSINSTTGALTALPFSPFNLGPDLRDSVRVHPNGSLVFVGDDTGGKVASIVVSATSAAFAPGSPVISPSQFYSLAVSQNGSFLYGGGEAITFSAFAINTSTGQLSALAGSPYALGETMSSAFVTDPQGRVFIANSASNRLRAFTTATGVPTGVTGNPFTSGLTGRGNGVRHQNGFYLAAGPSGARVGVFQIAGTGAATTLTAVGGSPYLSNGSGTNTLALNQAQTFVFAGNSGSRNISTFSINSTSGNLGTPVIQSANTLGTTGSVKGMAYFGTPPVMPVAGGNQSTVISTVFATALQVKVQDPATGNPIVGATVTFSAPLTGASGVFAAGAPTTSATTNASGIATAAALTANTIAGNFGVTATVTGVGSALFSLTNLPGAPAVLAASSGTPQTTQVRTAFGLALFATVSDSAGNTVSGASVTFTAPASGASGTFANGTATTTAQTSANGIASSGVFTANDAAGAYAVSAASAGLPPVSYSLTNTAAPIVTPVVNFTASALTQVLDTPITFTATASSFSTPTVNYVLNFGDGSPALAGSFAQGASQKFSHAFTFPATYTVAISVNDGVSTVNQSIAIAIVSGSSGGQGVPNVGQGQEPVVNPLNGMSVSVMRSDGGVVQLGINIDALNRAVFDVKTEFTDVPGKSSIASGMTPVHQFTQDGIFVATVTATDMTTGAFAGKARKTLLISSKEVGGFKNNSATPPGIMTSGFKGKFLFAGNKADALTYSGAITLPAGLDTSKEYDFSIGLGNVVASTRVLKGKGIIAKGDTTVLKSLRITYVKLKRDAVAKGGETAKVTAVFSAAGLVQKGFDTEGILPTGPDIGPGKGAPRTIQVAMLLDGVPFQVAAPVTLIVSRDSELGSIKGRN